MSSDSNFLPDPTPMTPEQLLAEMYRQNERLRRQLADALHERDEFKKFYLEELARNAPELTADDLANAVPMRPLIEQLIRRLEKQ